MKQALVIGGSGMLEGATLQLAERYARVYVVGRDADKLYRLTTRNPVVHPVALDYKDDGSFSEALETMLSGGKIDLVVAWIHSDAPRALQILIEKLESRNNRCVLLHVLGSRADLNHLAEQYGKFDSADYRQVQLGFIVDDSGSRWLTNEEISNGVVAAIDSGSDRFLVGAVSPPERRPSW